MTWEGRTAELPDQAVKAEMTHVWEASERDWKLFLGDVILMRALVSFLKVFNVKYFY